MQSRGEACVEVKMVAASRNPWSGVADRRRNGAEEARKSKWGRSGEPGSRQEELNADRGLQGLSGEAYGLDLQVVRGQWRSVQEGYARQYPGLRRIVALQGFSSAVSGRQIRERNRAEGPEIPWSRVLPGALRRGVMGGAEEA